MEMSEIIGYALLLVGILILVFDLVIGYNAYTALSGNLPVMMPQQGTQSNLNSTIKSLGDLVPTLSLLGTSDTALLISVVLLFLFASIGYKIAVIGIRMIRIQHRAQQAAGAGRRTS